MWSHREQLLKVARRRSLCDEDAEDAVHEAMLRAAEAPHLDDERLGAWLTTVTMRLCVDRYRQVNRDAEVRNRRTLVAPGPVPVEEVVCDRAEAKWLAGRSGELPARQAEALRLKSEDRDVEQVAREMGLSYEAVESLLARARRTLRKSLAGTLGVALCLCGRGKSGAGGGAQAVAMASTAATLAVLGFSLPHIGGEEDGPRPPHSSTSREAAPPSEPGGPPATGPIPADETARRSQGPALPSPVDPPPSSPRPKVSIPALSTLSAVPEVPAAPDAPDVPSLPTLLSTSSVPDIPDVSNTPEVPQIPDTSDVPKTPDVPSSVESQAPRSTPTDLHSGLMSGDVQPSGH